MCGLKRPFTGHDAAQLFAQIIRGSFEPIPTRYGKNVKLSVEAMLTPTLTQRPPAGELIQFPFIQTRIAAKIQENEAQLKTVNIMVEDSVKGFAKQKRISQRRPLPAVVPFKKVENPKSPRRHSPKLIDLELPLPRDEEAPR
jgi:hypothetical protein